jgi:hypothetical protein
MTFTTLHQQFINAHAILAPVLRLAMETLYKIRSHHDVWHGYHHQYELLHSASVLCAIAYWIENRFIGEIKVFSVFAQELRSITTLLWLQYLWET